ncbi:MAG: ferric reductase-like transmembrane domain-containing protein [Aureliella sp.]
MAYVAYVVIVSAPAVVATAVDPQVLSNGVIYTCGVVSGVLAYSMVCAQFILSARLNWVESFFGASNIYRMHRRMALAVIPVLIIHLGFLTGMRGNWELLLSPQVMWPIQFGRVAVAAVLITILYSLGRNWIPINNADWRFFHGVLAWIILLSGLVHSIALGASFESPVFAFLWMGYFMIAVLAWGHKWRLRRQTARITSAQKR